MQQHDITDRLFAYLEAKRHLWNSHFRQGATDLRECGALDDFEMIDKLLLNALILRPIAQALPDDFVLGVDPLSPISVRALDEQHHLPLLLSGPPPARERSWKNGQMDPRGRYDLHFIEFFDWDRYSHPSYPFVLVRIASAEKSPELVDHNALIESCRVQMYAAADGG